MQWWAWIAVGAILLGSELTFHRCPVLSGVRRRLALLSWDSWILSGLLPAVWLQWLLFALLAAFSMVTVPPADLRAHAPQIAGDEAGACR